MNQEHSKSLHTERCVDKREGTKGKVLTTLKKCLILRSARSSQLRSCVEAVIESSRKASVLPVITVLSHSSAMEEARKIPGVTQVLEFKGSRFNLQNLPLDLLKIGGEKRFDKTIFIHNNPSGHGYLPVSIFCLMLGETWVFTFTGELKRVTVWNLTVEMLGKVFQPLELLIHRILLVGCFIHMWFMKGRRK